MPGFLSALTAAYHGAVTTTPLTGINLTHAFFDNSATVVSPPYPWLFEYPLPMAPTAEATYSEVINGTAVDFYELTIAAFQKQIYPNLGPANFVGYNGMAPGPTFYIDRNTETVVRLTNNASGSAVMHRHGSWTRSPWDGWASDEIQPGQFKDYYYPNIQSARTLWYHAHVNHHTAMDAYLGQAGTLILYDDAENVLELPTGPYDIPLLINDKSYLANGDLYLPENVTDNFYGDVIHVNVQPWPYLNVEPRKYRLRLLNAALSRSFEFFFAQDSTGQQIGFDVIASDGGLFVAPVPSSTIDVSMGERYDIVIDFAPYANSNVTMGNSLVVPFVQEGQNTDKVMRFIVGGDVSDSSSNSVPSVLSAVNFPPVREQVDKVFNFQRNSENWTINGVDFDDINARVLARPPQGTVERWEFNYESGPGFHPVHVHLIDFQIISRVGGRRGLMPYETAGLKDVVLLAPGESVQVVAYYGPWTGQYMFHCHNLVHEDHEMMDVFNVTALQGLGYDDVNEYDDPLAPQFAAQNVDPKWDDEDYIRNTLLPGFVGSPAYIKYQDLVSSLATYYLSHPYGESDSGGATPTIPPTPGPAPTRVPWPLASNPPYFQPWHHKTHRGGSGPPSKRRQEKRERSDDEAEERIPIAFEA